MFAKFYFRQRAAAAAVHIVVSLAVAGSAAVLVFGVWYPGAYRSLAGGTGLFLLVTSVDLTLGPLLTFAVFNLKKGWPHLRRDLAAIAAMQCAAIGYGLHTVYIARPVALVFEVDRFRMIAATDVNLPELSAAEPEFRTLPLTGPWLLGTRRARSIADNNEAVFMGISGVDIAQRPSFWQPYAASANDALKHARPVASLTAKYPERAVEISARLRELKIDESRARFLPLTARAGDWVAIIDDAAKPVHFVPVDGFF